MKNSKINMSSKSVPVAIGIGAAVSLEATLIISAIVAMLIASGKLSPQVTDYAVMIMIMASSLVGTLVSTSRVKSKKLIISVMTAAVYFIVLLCITALLFDGMYQGIPATAMVVFGGGLINVLLPAGRNNHARGYIRNKRYG